MRLWSIHPQYLDSRGLVAGWREALLAQKVLAGNTRGYTRHPQLERFREAREPEVAIGAFLTGLCDEADARGYHFDRSKIADAGDSAPVITVSVGQLMFEWEHLTRKLRERAPDVAERWKGVKTPLTHPLFTPVEGEIASWERP